MAAMMGLRQRSMLVRQSCRSRMRRRRASRLRAPSAWAMRCWMPASMPRSMPAQKFRPAPLRIATRASGVASTHSQAWRISCHMASLMALDLSGRLRRISAICSASVRLSVVKAGRFIGLSPVMVFCPTMISDSLRHAGECGGEFRVVILDAAALAFDLDDVPGQTQLLCPVFGALTRGVPGPFFLHGPFASVAIGGNDAVHGLTRSAG